MPWRKLRAALRNAYFGLVEQTVRHARGRTILAGAVRGLVQSPPPIAEGDFEMLPPPYLELGVAPTEAAGTVAPAPIFITGRFRSGSTFLWNVFRAIPGVTSYYEPLNERRWFDPLRRGDRVDATHRNVGDYWREYEGLSELGAWYRQEWIDTDLYMEERYPAPHLKRYIELLIERARGTAVLQFNRVDFRLPWLRRQFPRARLVHIYRHPRDQWCSTLLGAACPTADLPLASFEPFDKFYLLPWVRDLRHQFAFLDEREIRHPYQAFYYLWRLSYLFGARLADISVCFEEVARTPVATMATMLDRLGLANYDPQRIAALFARPELGKWRSYASAAWFAAHEASCEATLAAHFRGCQPADLVKAAAASPP